MFSSFGAKVTLVVSRQQVLPQKDPEVAAVLEADFLQRGVQPVEGCSCSIDRPRTTTDGRRSLRRWQDRAQLARGAGDRVHSQQRRPRPRCCRCRGRQRWLRHHQPPLPEQRVAHLRGGRCQRQASSQQRGGDAGSQGRRARHGPAEGGASPSRLRQGRERHLHRAGDRRRRPRRSRRVRGGPQDPRDEGAVQRDAEGVDQQRLPWLREDRQRPRHRRGAWVARSSDVMLPN